MKNILINGVELEFYKVDKIGNIYNEEGRKLKPQTLTTGYQRIELNKGLSEKGRTYAVHRIVAETFLDNPNNHPVVNHLNGVKDDNRLENLEWCTRSRNQQHMYRVLGVKQHNNREVRQLCSKTGKLLDTFPSTMEASRRTGVNQGTIAYQARNISKSQGEFTWRYSDLSAKQEV